MANKPKFRIVDSHKYSRLGVRRKKKLKYRRPSGRDNKIRLNEKGRLRKVKIGFKGKKSQRGLIKNMKPVMIYNVNDIKKLKNSEDTIGIVGKIGNKKKKEISNYLMNMENKVKLLNLKPEKFLKSIEEKMKIIKGDKETKEKKKEIREKETKEKQKKESDQKIDEVKKENEEKIEEGNKNKSETDIVNENKVVSHNK